VFFHRQFPLVTAFDPLVRISSRHVADAYERVLRSWLRPIDGQIPQLDSLSISAQVSYALDGQPGGILLSPAAAPGIAPSRVEERFLYEITILESNLQEAQLRLKAAGQEQLAYGAAAFRVTLEQAAGLGVQRAALVREFTARWDMRDLRVAAEDALRSAAELMIRGTVRAPYAAEVQKVHVTEGRYVSSGDELLTIGPAEQRIAWIKLPASDPFARILYPGTIVSLETREVPTMFLPSEEARYLPKDTLIKLPVVRNLTYLGVVAARTALPGTTPSISLGIEVQFPRDTLGRWLVRLDQAQLPAYLQAMTLQGDSRWTPEAPSSRGQVIPAHFVSWLAPLEADDILSVRLRLPGVDGSDSVFANSSSLFQAAGYPGRPIPWALTTLTPLGKR
jgi:hypothetical protein